jgi:3-oxoacyl-[acyl-carrier-protein] synthase III
VPRPAILATGSAVPKTIRTNDDPIFDWLRAHPPPGQPLFEGYEERRILRPGERLTDLMVAAAQKAIDKAGLLPSDVDLLTGYASISEWQMPNELVVVAKKLSLADTAMVIPVNSEYANFNHGLVVADALLSAGHAKCALVVVGADWSRRVDYHTPPSVSAADGAGAALMAMNDDTSLFHVLDVATDAERTYLGGLYVAADPATPPTTPPTFLAPVFHLNQTGIQAFKYYGVPRPPQVVLGLLHRHGLEPPDVAFVGHQTSTTINRPWSSAFKWAVFIETLARYANMTSASIPVNLDVCADQISTSYVALVALGPEPSCNVVLLERAV